MKASSLKKTISLAAVLACSNAMAQSPINADEALDLFTGPNQSLTGLETELCVAVTPYFLHSMDPSHPSSHFVSVQINGVAQGGYGQAECRNVEQVTQLCERGFIKIKTTAPTQCYVPVSL